MALGAFNLADVIAHRRLRNSSVLITMLLLAACVVGWSDGCRQTPELLTRTSDIRKLRPLESRTGIPVELLGTIVSHEPLSGRIIVQDADGGIVVDASAVRAPLHQGQLVRVQGVTAPGDPVPIVIRPHVEILDLVDLPEAPVVTATLVGDPRYQGRLVSLEGVVRALNIDPDGELTLTVVSEGHKILVPVMEASRVRYRDLVDARVRLTGTPITVFDVRNHPFRPQLALQNLQALEVLTAPKRGDAAPRPIDVGELIARDSSELGEHRVRVRGVVHQWQAGSSIRVASGPHALRLQTAQMTPVSEGDSIDVLGFPDFQNGEVVLAEAVVRAVEPADTALASAQTPVHVLDRIADIRRLTPQQARLGHPVRLRAVVTFYAPDRYLLFVQDPTGGIYVSPHGLDPFSIRAGQLIELTGITGPGHFAPTVVQPEVRVLADAALPAPAPLSLEELFTGTGDSQWAQAEGIVQSIAHGDHGNVFMNVVNGVRRFRVQLPDDVSDLPENLVDAWIRVSGVCGTIFNNSRQLIGIQLFAPGLEYVEIVRPGGADPFATPVRAVNSLMQFDPEERQGHRVHVRGTVMLHEPGQRVYLRDDTGGIVVTASGEDVLVPGDQVDVVGFARIGDFSPVVEDAQVRRIGPGAAPEPIRIVTEEAMTGRFDGELVQIEAHLLDHVTTSAGQLLTLSAGQYIFTAQLDHTHTAQIARLRPGSLVRLTGVCVVNAEDGDISQLPRVRDFSLRLRSASDIAVVEPAPWWTYRNTMNVAGLAVALFLLAVGWVVVLRRRVRQQTEVIARRLELEESLKMQAEAANRAKSEFLANMSHEIRTPMNGIIGMTELAQTAESDRERNEYLDLVQHSAQALLSLINDILDFSKIEAGKVELEQRPFRLREQLTAALRTIAPHAHRKGIELLCDVEDAVPDHLLGDPHRLRQVILNLVGNAVKFTEHGEVLVRVETIERTDASARLHIAVADTGIGIPQDKQDLVFRAFEQADTSTSRKYGGTGLGLVISQRLVTLMDGRIWLESEPGEGSTFHVEARFGRTDEEAATPDTVGVNLDGIPVLIVDDNATNRRILERTVRSWKMVPESVASGEEALTALTRAQDEGRPFRLLLLDYLMPAMDGYAVAARARRRWSRKDLKIIILTSANQNDSAGLADEYAINAHVMKPYGQSDLREAVNRTLNDVELIINANGSSVTDVSPLTRPLRILLAEDNLINQKLVVTLLRKHGHEVEVVENGRLALEAYERSRFDVVLMDVQMPEMNGFEATRAIREHEVRTGFRTPIVAVTARAMEGDREQCYEAGMDDYVSKPIHFDQLFEVVSRVIGPEEADRPATAAPHDGPSGDGAAPLPPAIDKGSLLAVLDGDDELLGEILALFNASYHRDAEAILRAAEAGDGEALALASHKLKGAVGNLCARNAFTMLETLEKMGRANELGDAVRLSHNLTKELERVAAELYELTERHSTSS